jgi:hypothetical protein
LLVGLEKIARDNIARTELELQQLEDDHNFAYTCMDEYDLRKLRGHTRRVKDSTINIRRRHLMAAR